MLPLLRRFLTQLPVAARKPVPTPITNTQANILALAPSCTSRLQPVRFQNPHACMPLTNFSVRGLCTVSLRCAALPYAIGAIGVGRVGFGGGALRLQRRTFKTNKSVRKRFRRTANGLLKYGRSHTQHKLSKRRRATNRRLSQKGKGYVLCICR